MNTVKRMEYVKRRVREKLAAATGASEGLEIDYEALIRNIKARRDPDGIEDDAVPEKKATFINMLTKEERAQCIQAGMALKMAEWGAVPPSLDKEATNPLTSAFDLGTKGIVLGSVITGIPLGIMAHMVHRKTQEVRQKEKELQSKINYYTQATGNIESGLAGAGAY